MDADHDRLPAMLRAQADGHLPTEAAVDLLIGHATWLDRLTQDDLIDVFDPPDGSPRRAAVKWDDVAERLDDTTGGGFPDSGSAVLVLAIATSLVGRRRVDLSEMVRLDATNAALVTRAVAHASNNDLDVTIQRPHRTSILDRIDPK